MNTINRHNFTKDSATTYSYWIETDSEDNVNTEALANYLFVSDYFAIEPKLASSDIRDERTKHFNLVSGLSQVMNFDKFIRIDYIINDVLTKIILMEPLCSTRYDNRNKSSIPG